MKPILALLSLNLLPLLIFAQNSMVGDGFGGRLWYKPTNYGVGSYSAYAFCNDTCLGTGQQLYGWGKNNHNQLGLGIAYGTNGVNGTNDPTPIPNLDNVKFFSAGYSLSTIKNDNTGWVCGNSVFSTLEDPIQVISDVVYTHAGSRHTSFVKEDGSVWCIGSNDFGAFGNGVLGPIGDWTEIPVKMSNITNAVRVSTTDWNTVILLEDSTVMVTGTVHYTGLGATFELLPATLVGLTNIIDIKTTAAGFAALDAFGNVYYHDDYFSYNGLSQVDSLSDIIALSASNDGRHFLALDENKNCYAWGGNGHAQCGISDTLFPVIPSTSPILVATDVIDIMAGETFSYIVKSDGSLWVAGVATSQASVMLNLSDNYSVTVNLDSFTLLNPSLNVGSCSYCATEPIIQIPNIFSPNNDYINDNFSIEDLPISEMIILNRWGEVITTLDENKFVWDGTYNGKACSEGTYFYRAVHGDNIITGFIELVR